MILQIDHLRALLSAMERHCGNVCEVDFENGTVSVRGPLKEALRKDGTRLWCRDYVCQVHNVDGLSQLVPHRCK